MRPKHCIAAGIGLALCVLAAVGFQYQLCRVAGEIRNERADGDLAPELEINEATSAEQMPKHLFVWRRFTPKVTREGAKPWRDRPPSSRR